jgi:hypothetical protein
MVRLGRNPTAFIARIASKTDATAHGTTIRSRPRQPAFARLVPLIERIDEAGADSDRGKHSEQLLVLGRGRIFVHRAVDGLPVGHRIGCHASEHATIFPGQDLQRYLAGP